MAAKLKLVQLPIPQPAKPAATANVPLAAGCLAVAARQELPDRELSIELVDTAVTDAFGDAALADHVAAGEPDFVGLSLYLWNSERSLHLAREIKRRSPRTEIWIGGPEVGPDNPWVGASTGWDVAVSGEAEAVFLDLVRRRLAREPVADLPGVAVCCSGLALAGTGEFTAPRPADFALNRFPSPYLASILRVDPARSTYVETVRGCKSHCTFCFYPRSSAVLRALDVATSAQLLQQLKSQGAREVVFLDPTFNHRPDFDALLDAMIRVNHDRALRFFAEVRAEGLSEAHADKLAAAGFYRLEIGLQSVNPRTLATTRRGGNPAHVARAASLLRERGIELLVDLIVGLPGDSAADVGAGAEFLADHGLADCAQVFPLSVLPGTAMRAGAAADGLQFDARPPYRVQRTATMSADDIAQAFFGAEQRLDRMFDEFPRPYLVDPEPGQPADVFHCDVDGPSDPRLGRHGAEHAALWFMGRDLWARREQIRDVLEQRLALDPYCMLDVVLAPTHGFPLDLVDAIEAILDSAPESYTSRLLRHRGVNAQRRVTTVLCLGVRWRADYLAALEARVRVYHEAGWRDALSEASRHGADMRSLRIVGTPGPDHDDGWRMLSSQADPESVAFADRTLESRWVVDVLRYRDI